MFSFAEFLVERRIDLMRKETGLPSYMRMGADGKMVYVVDDEANR